MIVTRIMIGILERSCSRERKAERKRCCFGINCIYCMISRKQKIRKFMQAASRKVNRSSADPLVV